MQQQFRLSHSADRDVVGILEWSESHFGEAARDRYRALMEAAVQHASESRGTFRFKSRPELGDGVVSWHVSNSVLRSDGGKVKGPRHLLFCRWEGHTLAVGRILHEVMDPTLHITADTDWS